MVPVTTLASSANPAPYVISTTISRVSAALFAAAGLAFLFAGDAILPQLVTSFPPSGAWLGQLLAAGWLALAALNWFSRATLLGGIYGRPLVFANFTAYFISAVALVKVTSRGGAPIALVLAALVALILWVIYGWLLVRGPFERDFAATRSGQAP